MNLCRDELGIFLKTIGKFAIIKSIVFNEY